MVSFDANLMAFMVDEMRALSGSDAGKGLAPVAATPARVGRATEDAYCAKCQTTTSCFSYGVQSRGADEGQTMHYECTVCRAKWTLNT